MNLREPNHERVAELNDMFRKTVFRKSTDTGTVLLSQGFQALPIFTQLPIFVKICMLGNDEFEEENNPYGEHDFGAIEMEGGKIFWKIDYYKNSDMEYGTDDKENCYRLLTLMLAEEY